MSKPLTLSKIEIASKIKARKPFWISGKAEQKMVLTFASFTGVKLSTRADERGGFNVFFI